MVGAPLLSVWVASSIAAPRNGPVWLTVLRQLLSKPLTRGEFLRQPALSPRFFASGLELLTPDRSQVDVQGATNTLALWSYTNVCSSGDQQWYVHDTGGGRHTIRQGGSGGRCLDLSAGKLGTWDCNYGPNQLWYFDLMTDGGADGLYGTWKIRSAQSNSVIDLAGDNTANGTSIATWSDTGGDNQRWILWGNGGMHKDFEDDFNGNGLDTGTWSAANFGGTFNSELQNYSPGQVQVYNGTLHINTSYNSGCNGGTGMGCYQSGRISSKGKRWNSNGMFSARVHYYDSGAANMGTWPAW